MTRRSTREAILLQRRISTSRLDGTLLARRNTQVQFPRTIDRDVRRPRSWGEVGPRGEKPLPGLVQVIRGDRRKPRQRFRVDIWRKRVLGLRDQSQRSKQQDAQWAGLRASGWTDEGVAGIGEHMRRTGCDIATAVAQFEKLNPPAELVATTNGGRFHFLSPQPSGVSMKGLLEDADGWLDGAIAASLRESRGM